MRRLFIGMLLTLAAMPAFAQAKKEPINLRDMGSFHIGGRVIDITGQPVREVVFTPGGVPAKVDPNGKYQVEQMYVQYFLPQNRKGKLPLLLWHGGGLTGVTYESKPDGGDGWMHYFISSTFKGEAMSLPFGDPWERFRIGPPGSWNDDPAKRTTYPGEQFPVQAYAQFMKQGVPRWVTTDDEIIKAYIELIDKVCPCVVLVHSQSGKFGYQALEARPDKVKALVAVEPTLGGDKSKIASVKGTPILVVIGDNAKDHPRWKNIRNNSVTYAQAFKAAGGSLDLIDLPDIGIKGNSHMMMMDKNSDQIAGLIQDWLVKKGLSD
ncbi:MAG: esterase [Rhizobiales bacterium]|nr:esterase [Hyphomicrobiales bacterium]